MAIEGFLRQVVEERKVDIEAVKRKVPAAAVRNEAEQTSLPASFKDALAGRTPERPGIIAEIKKASPSRGDIRLTLDVAEYAASYTRAGACAISVLTEPRYFKGSLKDLETACKATSLPVLCKDFVVTSYQVYEARRAGASSILLITPVLSGSQLAEYIMLSRELGLEPLVEINCEKQLEAACRADAKIIGINNRNLETLAVDTTVSRRISRLIPEEIIRVEASGIGSRKDIEKGIEARFFNFLVGESIVRAKDPEKFIQSLITPFSD